MDVSSSHEIIKHTAKQTFKYFFEKSTPYITLIKAVGTHSITDLVSKNLYVYRLNEIISSLKFDFWQNFRAEQILSFELSLRNLEYVLYEHVTVSLFLISIDDCFFYASKKLTKTRIDSKSNSSIKSTGITTNIFMTMVSSINRSFKLILINKFHY